MNFNPTSMVGAPGQTPGMNPIMQMLQGVLGLLMGLVTGGLMGGLLSGGAGAMPSGNPGFGGSPSSGGGGCGCGGGGGGLATASNAATNFLGAGGSPAAGGSPGFGGSNAPSVDLGSIQGGTDFGRTLAQDAAKNATGPGGLCYKYVAQALGRHGVSVSGASAYMGADQLAKNPKFREVQIPPSQFKSLPPGAVVVWNKGPGHPHGHISIALGDGREASDKIRNQITNYGTSARVFLPK